MKLLLLRFTLVAICLYFAFTTWHPFARQASKERSYSQAIYGWKTTLRENRVEQAGDLTIFGPFYSAVARNRVNVSRQLHINLIATSPVTMAVVPEAGKEQILANPTDFKRNILQSSCGASGILSRDYVCNLGQAEGPQDLGIQDDRSGAAVGVNESSG